MATKKELEQEVKDLVEKNLGLKEIYKDGITKNELWKTLGKGVLIGLVTGVVLSHLVL